MGEPEPQPQGLGCRIKFPLAARETLGMPGHHSKNALRASTSNTAPMYPGTILRLFWIFVFKIPNEALVLLSSIYHSLSFFCILLYTYITRERGTREDEKPVLYKRHI